MSAPTTSIVPEINDRVARVEAQAAIVDRHLTRPAHWNGPLAGTDDAGGRLGDGWSTIVAAYNRIAEDPGPVLSARGLRALHCSLAGGRRRGGAQTVSQALASLVPLVALGEPAPLAAARLEIRATQDHHLGPSFGWTARLAACAVLLRAGWRSSLVCCLADDLTGDGMSWSRAVPRGPAPDEAARLNAMLHAMALRTDAVARYRSREESLRAALTRYGVPEGRHSLLLQRFETVGPGEQLPDPALAAAFAVSAPWPQLAPGWGDMAARLPQQLERLLSEEASQGRRAPTGRPVCLLRPVPRPLASVIVPAYDDASSIAAVLHALEQQDFTESYEVIVVASGTDATTEIVRLQFPGTVLFHTPDRLTPGAARNAGVKASRGDVIAFVAADCVPARDWLRRRVEAHRRGHALVGGFVDSATPSTWSGWAQYFAKFWSMQSLHRASGLRSGPLFHLSYTRTVLARPWNETAIAGEDTAFNDALVRAGHEVWFDAAIRVFHVNARHMRVVLREQHEQGYASGRLAAREDLDRYFRPLMTGPWMPLVLGWRCLTVVARSRRRLLARCLLALPLTVTAMAVRRLGFRRGRRDELAGAAPAPETTSPVPPLRCAITFPAVSVIVPAFNEADVIGPCLVSLLQQTGTACEVIVVDDGSRDRTGEIATAKHVRVVRIPHGGPAAAKNAGAAVAHGQVLVFFDADLVADRSAMAALSAPIIAGTTAGTFTADIMVANPDNGWADCWTHNRGARPGAHFAARLPRHWENFRAVRHDLFADVGGFEDVGYGEDMTLSPKLGVKAEQVAGARLWHHNPSTWREVWSNARWVGRGEAVRSRPAPPRYRDLGRSLRRGLRGARAIGRPRFVLFALTYDIGLLTGYRRRAKGRRRTGGHAK